LALPAKFKKSEIEDPCLSVCGACRTKYGLLWMEICRDLKGGANRKAA